MNCRAFLLGFPKWSQHVILLLTNSICQYHQVLLCFGTFLIVGASPAVWRIFWSLHFHNQHLSPNLWRQISYDHIYLNNHLLRLVYLSYLWWIILVGWSINSFVYLTYVYHHPSAHFLCVILGQEGIISLHNWRVEHLVLLVCYWEGFEYSLWPSRRRLQLNR